MAPAVRRCLAQGVSCGVILKVVVDMIMTVLDAALDILISYKFFQAGHRKWFSASVVAILLPGITCTLAQFLQRSLNKTGGVWYRGLTMGCVLKIFVTLFCYPFWVLYLGFRTLTNVP